MTPVYVAVVLWLLQSSNVLVVGAMENLHLKAEALEQSEVVSPAQLIQLNGDSFIQDVYGRVYNLNSLEPYTEIFSPKHFVPSRDKKTLTDTRTGEVMNVPISKATYDDGSTVLVERDGSLIQYIELRRPQGEPNLFLVPALGRQTGGSEDNAGFLAFTEEDVDYNYLEENFRFGEASIFEEDAEGDDVNELLRFEQSTAGEDEDAVDSNDEYQQEREYFIASSLRSCTSYQIVPLTVVFDAEFCEIYGSLAAAKSRIMTIIASASFHYERDLCVKLVISDVYSPESTCSTRNSPSFFEDFDRDFACGGGPNVSFLSKFRSWMRGNRRSLGFDSDAIIHIFSGSPPPGGTIGCAWVGAFCSSYSYGIEYMGFSSNPHSQGVVLAHEIGHNLVRRALFRTCSDRVTFSFYLTHDLFFSRIYVGFVNVAYPQNAPHMATSSSYRHVMEPNINNAADGFSQFSVNRILTFLNSESITCDGTTDSIPTRTPTFPPTLRPTQRPTRMPTKQPTLSPIDASKCTIFQDTTHAPICLLTSSSDDKFACYDTSVVLNARATSSCMFPIPRARITRCDGPLRSGRIPQDQVQRDTNGNMLPPGLFETNSCSASSCVVVSNFVCFRASSQERAYSIQFTAVADVDVSQTFTTEPLVKASELSNGGRLLEENDCDVATTVCSSISG